ncbi:NisI/SpaI family lantibiotic immunity lipoprotein [Longicatena caecimuris]|uniref:NisI/SpaI family lantibiotic immunity lipoprotein n=1 Tax=Longicatena caecimuris TaxID=1796635 RepID=UPI0022E5D5C3|nr:NisI/SpaI family lantibiotic immunity lipoprotein [Longicatena caecimuris]
MIKKIRLLCVCLITLTIFFTGCNNRISDTADKNNMLNDTLPKFELNVADYNEISFDNKTYIITEKTIPYSELGGEIGQISQNITTIEGNKLRYGYVYTINDTTDIAVNINEKYYIAEMVD